MLLREHTGSLIHRSIEDSEMREVEVIVVRPFSAGRLHYAIGQHAKGPADVMGRMVNMGKARYATDRDPSIGAPEVTRDVVKRGGR